MNAISDNDLILYFYRDGLDSACIRQIDDALFASPGLRARYTRLQHLLHGVDALPVTQADAQFVERIWDRLDASLAGARTPASPSDWPRRLFALVHARAARVAFASACLMLAAIGAGFLAGRLSAPQPDEIAQTRANAMAAHVLDAYVAEHLRATEGLLMTAVNSDDTGLVSGNRDLAASLVDSNRLYAQAAVRSGNTRLADFLRQLEPVLLELANQPADAPIQSLDGLRDYLRKTDLLFQVRATQARIDVAGKHRT